MIYELANARRLAATRCIIFCIWFWELARDPFERLAALPPAFFEPLGPWRLLTPAALGAVWNEASLLGLRLLTLTTLMLALLGIGSGRAWAGGFVVLATTCTSFVRGFGHVNHAQVQLLLVTIVLCAAPAWDALAVHRDRPLGSRNYGFSFAMLALVFAFPYFETGVHRLAREGAQLFVSDAIAHFIVRDTSVLDDFEFTQGLWLGENTWTWPLLNLGFALVTCAELAAPWVHHRRLTCLLWLSVMLPFHLLSPVIMHVFFLDDALLALLLYGWPLSWKAATD